MKALAFTVAATVDLEEICNYTEGEWWQAASVSVTHCIWDGTGMR